MLEHALFERLPNWSQVEMLNRNGILLAQRAFNGSTVSLYALNDFFVERWSKNQVEVIGSFYRTANPMQIFEPYLNGVEVEGIEE
ncbi:hypothetical protein [Rufibacter roseus]|uniref:Uncharacterized protein n=1 Tax=Rufibacter roseus TaxID=1567108 RepID=A0ABW2DTJ0_9BACT|nr:hypothetical protein [Rufibacter roseus]